MSIEGKHGRGFLGRRGWAFQLAALAVLAGMVLLLAWFRRSPDRVEAVFSQGLFPIVGRVQQTLFGWFPISVGDLFYVAVVAYGLVLSVRLVRGAFRRQWALALWQALRLVNLVLLLYVVFYAFWGLNYFRVPLERQLGLEDVQPGIADLVEVAHACIDSANALREQLGDMPAVGNREIHAEAARLLRDDATLPAALFVHQPRAKSPLTNAFGNYMGVSGYFNPYSHEANVNSGMPVWVRPFTACHELAHQAGIGFEDEANYIGFVLARQSDDALFRYSAYYATLWMLMRDVHRYDRALYQQLFDRVSPGVLDDATAHQAYWERYLGLFNTITEAFYGQYLEANNQPEGLQRYDRMVRLVVAAYMRERGCE